MTTTSLSAFGAQWFHADINNQGLKFIKTIAALLITSMVLGACAITPEAKLSRALKQADKTSHALRPVLYAKLEREGKISPSTRKTWMDAWTADDKRLEQERIAIQKEVKRQEEERRKWWASLTPGQKLQYEMQERALALQQQQMAFQAQQQAQAAQQAAVQNAIQQINENNRQQQEINAYNMRTWTLGQPVNVNYSGAINHNVRVSGY